MHLGLSIVLLVVILVVAAIGSFFLDDHPLAGIGGFLAISGIILLFVGTFIQKSFLFWDLREWGSFALVAGIILLVVYALHRIFVTPPVEVDTLHSHPGMGDHSHPVRAGWNHTHNPGGTFVYADPPSRGFGMDILSLLALALIAIFVLLLVDGLVGGGGTKKTVVVNPTATFAAGTISFDEIYIEQDSERHPIKTEDLRGAPVPAIKLESDSPAQLVIDTNRKNLPVVLNYTQGNQTKPVEARTDSDGNIKFELDTSLPDLRSGNNFDQKVVQLRFDNNPDLDSFFVMDLIVGIDSGSVTNGNMLNNADELYKRAGVSPPAGFGSAATVTVSVVNPTRTPVVNVVSVPTAVPVSVVVDRGFTSINIEADPTFIAAFTQFCGFSPHDGMKVYNLSEHHELQQAALGVNGFGRGNSLIPANQPVFYVVSANGSQNCVINPPCGNPSVPPEQVPNLPEIPLIPKHSVPPQVIPSATPTSQPPVPTATTKVLPPPPTATNTRVPNTPVPPFVPTQTPAPRPTTDICCTTPPPTYEPDFPFPTVPPAPVRTSNPEPTVAPPRATPTPITLPKTVVPTAVP